MFYISPLTELQIMPEAVTINISLPRSLLRAVFSGALLSKSFQIEALPSQKSDVAACIFVPGAEESKIVINITN